MGCVSSKHLKQQASVDGWTSPASRATTPRAKTITSNYTVECYHRHFVSLTSTSYGSLKIESPKPAEVRLTHDRAAFSSLNQMYGKLRTLEMVDSAHINRSPDIDSRMQRCLHKSPMQLEANDQWSNLGNLGIMDSAHVEPMCNVNNLQNTFSPWVYESPSQLEESHQWSINPSDIVLPETINVKEMMLGLEEAAPSCGSSPAAKRAPSTSGTPKAKNLKQNRHLKKKVNVTEHPGAFRNNWNASAAECSDGAGEFGKENTSPFHGQQQIRHPLPKPTRSPMGNTPLSQVSHLSYKSASSASYPCSRSPPLLKPSQPTSKSAVSMKSSPSNAESVKPVRGESIVARRVAVERGSSNSSPGLSSTSLASARSVQYAPTNGKVKLTLQTQHQNGATTIFTPSPIPSRSRRLAIGGGFASAESSSPTFDPDLVASYEKALRTVSQGDWNASHADIPKANLYSPASTAKTDRKQLFWSSNPMPTTKLDRKLYDPFDCFKVKCPPGGEKAVVLYTTTLRGIRKTFEDCNTAREILQSFGLSIDERDVSMHLEFLNELRELMDRVVSVPRMFIKGWYIGGIEEVVKLHEDGKLSELVDGLPKQINGGSCDGCGGVRFVPCLECSGSCKVRSEEDNGVITRCPDCNENGLIQCPICT